LDQGHREQKDGRDEGACDDFRQQRIAGQSHGKHQSDQDTDDNRAHYAEVDCAVHIFDAHLQIPQFIDAQDMFRPLSFEIAILHDPRSVDDPRQSTGKDIEHSAQRHE